MARDGKDMAINPLPQADEGTVLVTGLDLARARSLAGLTQRQIAAAACMSRSLIAKIEAGGAVAHRFTRTEYRRILAAIQEAQHAR